MLPPYQETCPGVTWSRKVSDAVLPLDPGGGGPCGPGKDAAEVVQAVNCDGK